MPGNTAAQQAALAPSPDLAVTSTNVVDVLSQDPELSLFIRLLQRARLIPTLNKIHDATVFAPTNEAVRNRSIADPVLAAALLELEESANQEELDGRDNLQYRLRERLFYHILNYTSPDLSFPDVLDSRIAYESTLLFPTTHEEHGRPGHVPYPAPEDTLLGGEGQKLSLLRETQEDSGDDVVTRVGVGGGGAGGAAVIPGRGGRGRNGRVVVIDDLLHPPKSIAHQIRKRAGAGAGPGASDNDTQPGTLSRFASLLSEEMWKKYTEDSHTTLFVPHDKAFDALHPLEWKYLTSGFAADDILQIANNHQAEYKGDIAHREKVGYLDRLLEVKTIPVLSGSSVAVSRAEDGGIALNGSSTILSGNILASNGVLHVISSLLLPYGSLALTPEKYLLALNATKFVSLFRENGLPHLLQSSPYNETNNGSYTILAASDDILDRMLASPFSALPPAGSRELSETLQYHVLQGKYTPEDLRNGQLVRTMLTPPELARQPQRLAVSVSHGKGDKETEAKHKEMEIAFGDARVIAEPVEVGNCIIYLISRMVEPPSTLVSTALDKGLSTFIASVYSSGLDKKLLHDSPATSVLAPTNAAFDYLGLALNYFLLPRAQQELAELLSYHTLDKTVYLSELEYDSEHFQTLAGPDIYLERNGSDSQFRVRGPQMQGLPVNGESRSARIKEADILTASGVLHVIDQVELPPTINITSEKLMRGARASTFPDLLRQTNMSWIAEGKQAPPEGFWEDSPLLAGLSEREQASFKKGVSERGSYTLLCPTDKAFGRINLTHYTSNLPALLALVQLHIIPTPPASGAGASDPLGLSADGKPIALAEDSAFSTLYSRSAGGQSKYGEVAFRRKGDSWLVGIKGARGTNGRHDKARILNHGRNTLIFAEKRVRAEAVAEQAAVFGGGIFLIDAVLEPYEPNWWHRWGYIAAIVLISLAATALVGVLVYKLYERNKPQKHWYDELPQGPEEPEDG